MNKTKKIALLVAVPAFALLLSGCGSQTAPISQAPVVKQEMATPAPMPPQNVPQQQDPVASPAQPLPPLPANNKKAIDAEINGIDNSLKATDNLVNSADLSNTQLGL